MKRQILGPIAVIALRMIGAWPGSKNLPVRLLIWICLVLTFVGQIFYVLDYERHTMGPLMEALAITITSMLTIVKFAVLWINRGLIEECLDMMEEDWKKMRDEKYLAIMSRVSQTSRTFYVGVAISYYCTVISFVIGTLLRYTPEDPDNFQERELVLKAKYPFNVFHSPFFEFISLVGMIQGGFVATGNGVGDGLLFVLTSHVNGQLDILHDRLRQFTDVEELTNIVQTHQRLIHFADIIDTSFKWIALAEFVSVSVVICAVGYVLVTTLESNPDGLMILTLLVYMFVMQLGSFIYCHTGNILTEKTLNIRQAAYESSWVDMPPETSRMLTVIMMRADKPISITAGGFCNLNYESWLNISRTAASYLSVIRASID